MGDAARHQHGRHDDDNRVASGEQRWHVGILLTVFIG
jgi:hypothetical protein